MKKENKTEPLEELFIPFLNDEEDEEFGFLQYLWQNDKDVLEQLKTAIKNQEQDGEIKFNKQQRRCRMNKDYYELGLDKIPIEVISVKDLKIEKIPPDNVMRSLAEILFPTVEEFFNNQEETDN